MAGGRWRTFYYFRGLKPPSDLPLTAEIKASANKKSFTGPKPAGVIAAPAASKGMTSNNHLSTHARSTADAAAVYAVAAPSVLSIESLNTSGAVASRVSAVVVAPELVVTDCQTVQYAPAVRVRPGGSEYTALPDTTDSTFDLCALRVLGLNAPAALRGSA